MRPPQLQHSVTRTAAQLGRWCARSRPAVPLVRKGRGSHAPEMFGLSMVLASLLLLTGCSATRTGGPVNQVDEPLIWPSPPELPRIAYVQSLSRPADGGVKVSGWTRFANWITGSDKGNEALIKPFGIGLDEKDNVCLTDMGANAVCYWDRGAQKWKRWDKVGAVAFLSPVAVTRRKGSFYVADSGLASVVVFDSGGELQFLITNKLERPSGLAVFKEQLFVADSRRHCVVCFDLRGRFQFEFGRRGTGPGQFNHPTHIGADKEGRLFVTDSMNGRVQIFTVAGEFLAQIGSFGDGPGYFSRPKGVAVDAFGHVYVIDALFDNVQVFDQGARFLLNWGEAGTGRGQFWLPNGIAISGQDEIFIADSYNRRVQVFKYIGQP